jgi:dihydrolipoamide dehydrogenase
VGSVFSAPNIIIATGSETKWLPQFSIFNFQSSISNFQSSISDAPPRVVDSTGLLALDTLPKRLAIIGAGVIGMEFASAFNRFGSEVTVIEYLKECLPALDSDIAKRLRKYLEKQGITFHLQCAVKRIDDGKIFFEDKKGKTDSVEADVVLMATGRKPRTDGLNLESLQIAGDASAMTAGITLAPNGAIPVDDNLRVLGDGCQVLANTQIYAIGDANGRQMLAHAAEMQAIRAVNHILGKPDNIRFDIMPAAIFTTPEAACVGPTEDQLKGGSVAGGSPAGIQKPAAPGGSPAGIQKPAAPSGSPAGIQEPAAPGGSPAGIPYECRKAFWRTNGKALTMNAPEGMLKLFSEPDAGRILGCHAYGPHSADIIQEVSVLMCRDTTVAQLRDMVHIHPTLSEILLTAAES